MSISVPAVATRRSDGALIAIGDVVTSFRGEPGVLLAITRCAIPGKSGKVVVCPRATPADPCEHRTHIEHYDGVWGLDISAMRSCGHPANRHELCDC